MLVHGLNEAGAFVHVSKAERHKPTGLKCPECSAALVVKRGDKRIHHFAHKGALGTCRGGVETAVHLLAKQALANALRVQVPSVIVHRTYLDPYAALTRTAIDAHETNFDEVKLEVSVESGRRFDAVGYATRGWLAIEVKVHHAVDDDKSRQLAEAGIECVEIDLTDWAVGEHTEDEIAEAVLSKAPRRWVTQAHRYFAPEIAEATSSIEAEYEKVREAKAAQPYGDAALVKGIQAEMLLRRSAEAALQSTAANTLPPFEERTKFTAEDWSIARRRFGLPDPPAPPKPGIGIEPLMEALRSLTPPTR